MAPYQNERKSCNLQTRAETWHRSSADPYTGLGKGHRNGNTETSGYQQMKHNYLVIYEQAEDGSVSAYAPELQPGAVASSGKDYEEARRMIAEAISLYLEEMQNSQQPVTPSPVRYELLEIAS